ncbi:MFS general substrate transporter [Dothidotthia symphoricarpi CBS 119687]|uniref:MFS general substrate transporter n=1 Tax=Dothidotthia symphoricarpi CBS 119687 TaxID=1392245 RepID=A0A6A6ABS4_9PLEO|nr:MFS general substrate transporter [Dothidotthia symphoricarpi CBS 119687]KAF2129392.1 MFS general substrate transporter [Dothidotthia symphoricarpi CBS 119687]
MFTRSINTHSEDNIELQPYTGDADGAQDVSQNEKIRSGPLQDANKGAYSELTVVDSTAEPAYPSGLVLWIAVTTLCVGIFLTTLDNTILATARPYITDEFHSLKDIGWYANIYPMAICMSQLLFGKLSARYSIRWIYSISMLFFLVGSAVCGAAPNSPALIAGRAIAGVGSSGLLIGTFSLVPFLAPVPKRPVILSCVAIARSLASICGPLLGGALTEQASWRWNFWINLPIEAALQVAFFFFVRPPKRESQAFTSWNDFFRSLDLFGLTAIAPGVACLLLALQWGGIDYAWDSSRIIVLFVLFAVLSVTSIAIEAWQGDQALLPPRVSTQRTVISVSFFAFCTAGAIFVLTYYLPTWFQGVKGYSPILSGVYTLPWVLSSTFTLLTSGVIISKFGYPNGWIFVGSIFCAIGSGLFTTFEVTTSTGRWIGYQILFGVGSSLSSLIPLMVVQKVLPLDDVPIGSSLVMFAQTIGGSIFVSVAQAIFTNNLSYGLQKLDIGLDASAVVNGGITTITNGLTGDIKLVVLRVFNDALTQSWQVTVVLSCASFLGALAIDHRSTKMK